MSDQDIKRISALTGTFALLRPTPEKAAAGNASPDSGKKLPLPDSETGEIIRQIPPENAKTYVSDMGDVALRLYDKQV